ncbi:MAG: hypothetical protein M1816_004405 [Peltula sp. TS41687]|nr:MAG: hypothetical protein M1816_004405 [Peltula sp. TS41687]
MEARKRLMASSAYNMRATKCRGSTTDVKYLGDRSQSLAVDLLEGHILDRPWTGSEVELAADLQWVEEGFPSFGEVAGRLPPMLREFGAPFSLKAEKAFPLVVRELGFAPLQ